MRPSRIHFTPHAALLLVLSASFCVSLAIPEGAPADDNLAKYLEILTGQRQQSQDRYQRWREERNQNWERSRGEPQTGGVQIQTGDVPAGSYQIELPWGGQFRVNVQRPAEAPDPRAQTWGGQTYYRYNEMAGQLEQGVENVAVLLRRDAAPEQLQTKASATVQHARQLEQAIRSQSPPDEIRNQFRAFDEAWHPVAHQSSELRLSQRTKEWTDYVSRIDGQFHNLLRIGEAPVYDRVRVVGLAYHLAQTASEMEQHLQADSARDYDRVRGGNAARRVKSQADSFFVGVRDNGDYNAVVEEFQYFDSAWNDLGDRLRRRAADAAEQRNIQHVDQLVHELRNELLVNPPHNDPPYPAMRLAENISRSADHLLQDLRRESRGRGEDTAQQAWYFAQDAKDLEHQLSEHPQDVKEALRQALQSWRTLRAELQRGGHSDGHLATVTNQIERDLGQLQRLLG